MLTGKEIIKNVFNGRIRIDPFVIGNVGPNSVDLTLSPKLRYYTSEIIEPKSDNATSEITIPEYGYVLDPHKLYLGSTNELTGSSFYVPMLHGRSSMARLGICAHISAGLGDLGWFGQWTLEMWSPVAVRIYPNMRLCQVTFDEASGELCQYEGKYQGQIGPTASKMFLDKQNVTNDTYPFYVCDPILAKIKANKAAYLPWDKQIIVTDNGDVFMDNGDTRLISSLSIDNKFRVTNIGGESVLTHELIAMAFLGYPFSNNKRMVVTHKNGDIYDNRLVNLEYR